MTHLEPDKDTIKDHLRHLFAWTSPEGKLEIRCIHPQSKKIKSELFACHDYHSAAEYADHMNRESFNVYVTVNPLRPDVDAYAKDSDVSEARWQFVDIDGTDDPSELLES